MAGKNLVIEGPPGTGKSQTITNIAAAALASGKRVLFMADPQAALQVVKDRLDKVGLGDFCLELHSGKARKKDVLDSLERRLNRRPSAMGKDALDASLRELAATREALTRYVETLNSPLGAFGATVHDVLWADRRRRDGEGDVARRLDELGLPSCEVLTRSDIERRKAVLDRFERAADPILSVFGNPSEHPWHGVTRGNLPSVDVQRAVRETDDAAGLIELLARAVAGLEELGVETGTSLQDIQVAIEAIARLPVQPDIPTSWHRGLSMDTTRRAAEDWLHACEVYQYSLAELRNQGIRSDGSDGTEVAERLEACWNTLTGIAPRGLSVKDRGADERGRAFSACLSQAG